MIYLFCNTGYGLQLMRTAIQWSESNNAPLCLVFSDNRRLPASPIKKLIARFRRHIDRVLSESRFKKDYGVPVLISHDINSFCFRRRIHKGSHGIITGFNQIFDDHSIDHFESLVNFHPSILPLYRGPAPSYWCLKNNERRTGYTLHKVSEKIDSGEVLFQDTVEIDNDCDETTLDQKIAHAACPTLLNYLYHINNGQHLEKTQINTDEVYTSHVDYASFPSN